MLPDTMIFLNSEGLIKAKNAEHRVFNEKRMLGSALQAMKLDPRPKQFIENMLDAVHRFEGDFEQREDIAMLAIKFKGGKKLLQSSTEADQEPENEPEVEQEVVPEKMLELTSEPEPKPVEEPKVIEEPEVIIEPEVIAEPEVIEEAEVIDEE